MKSARMLLVVMVVAVGVSVGLTAAWAQNGEKASKQLLDEADKLVDVQKYAAAKKRLDKINPEALGFFEKGKYNSLLETATKGMAALDRAEKAMQAGKAAMDAGQYATAIDKLKAVAENDYVEEKTRDTAKGVLEVAKQRHEEKLAEAKALLKRAQTAMDAGKTADAADLVARIDAMDVEFGLFERMALKDLKQKLPAAGTAVAETPEATDTEEAEEAEVVEVAEADGTGEVAEADEAEEADDAGEIDRAEEIEVAEVIEVGEVEEGETENVVEGEAAIDRTREALSVAEQARRAEAQDRVQLARQAMQQRDFEVAKRLFREALKLWPEYEAAQQGLTETRQFLAETEPSVLDTYGKGRAVERGQIIARVNELLDEVRKEMLQAERAEDYTDALEPLAEASRRINRATVLTPETAEELREDIHRLRADIRLAREQMRTVQQRRAEEEARRIEAKRIDQQRQEREQMKAKLWQEAKDLRESMRFASAIRVLDRLLEIDPDNERAVMTRDELLWLESRARMVDVRHRRHLGNVEQLTDVEKAGVWSGEEVHGDLKPLRYPEPKVWAELTRRRREATARGLEESKPVTETRKRLQEKIDLDFQKTPLDSALQVIGEIQRGLNIVIDPDIETVAGIRLSDRLVDLKVEDVTVEAVLDLVLGGELGYKVEPGYVLVTTREKLQQNLPVVTYPVQDLVAQIPMFGEEAPRFDIGDITEAAAGASGGGGEFGELFETGGAAEESTGVDWEKLVDIIQRNVSSLTHPGVAGWQQTEGGPAVIDYMNGNLIVTQTAEGHARVAEMMDKLRRERAIMISVEARFIRVSDDFLQDISLDFDVSMDPDNRRWNPGGGGIQNPGGIGRGSAYDTLPGVGEGTTTVTHPEVDPDTGNIIGYNTFQIPAASGNRRGQPVVVSSTSSNAQGTSRLLPLAGSAFSSFAGANEGGLVVSGVFLDDIQVGFLLRAIQADVRTQTLSAPRITLFNGQRAYIAVATVLTYIADAEPIVGEGSVAWDPIIRGVPTGMTLDVKATVSADRRYVQMDLRPQVATVERPIRQVIITAGGFLSTANIAIELPVVELEDLKTTASVPDGGTLLLGGAKIMSETEGEVGVPILSKVPILRRLFNNRGSLREAENLVILVKPKIILQSEEEMKIGVEAAGVASM